MPLASAAREGAARRDAVDAEPSASRRQLPTPDDEPLTAARDAADVRRRARVALGAGDPDGATAAARSAQDDPQLLVGVEVRRDRFRYHFDQPSAADTPFLVPHFFEQKYDADNVWMRGHRGALQPLACGWETSVGATPQRDGRADDFDTFFDPGNCRYRVGHDRRRRVAFVLVSQRAEVGRA